MSESNNYFIIAINVFEESKTKMLVENAPEIEDEAEIPYDLSEFIGQGVIIARCYPTDASEDTEETYISLDYWGRIQTFVVIDEIRDFPLIEGTVEPGIYQLEQQVPQYYALYNNNDLNKGYLDLISLYDIRRFKLICERDKIIWQWLAHKSDRIELKRHSFAYLDLVCPVCSVKVSGYETANGDPFCRIYERDCPHFAGGVMHEKTSGYEESDLRRLEYDYQLVGEELYLKRPDSDWVKPVVFKFGKEDDSIHSYSEATESLHFLFINSI